MICIILKLKTNYYLLLISLNIINKETIDKIKPILKEINAIENNKFYLDDKK